MTETHVGIYERLAIYRKAEVALRDFFSATNYCLPNCLQSKEKWGRPKNIGCCNGNAFEFLKGKKDAETRKTIKEFKRLQKENAACQNHREGECDYHSETGCQIERYLSPLCLGFVCSPYSIHLKNQYHIMYSSYGAISLLQGILEGREKLEEVNVWLTKVRKATERVKQEQNKKGELEEIVI